MGDVSARTSSALAITEKKPQIQRVGGCVGIFFQLFDWNRRFSKKKFFPKKLLPPARAKVSKKFNADEKLPVTKHLLMADENSGGFPSKMKKKNGESRKHEMQAPGLVAKLMGLEAIPVPVIENDKSNRTPPKDEYKGKGGGFGGEFCNADLSPEKGNVRPQKLQKTGVSDRKPVTRFGAEAFQIKNVLSRSRKHNHHPKLASPVKSPKVGRNTSRLIDAATRILEPGIQATNRARCSLSYPSSMGQDTREDMLNEKKGDVDLQNEACSKFSASKALNAEAACRSCGNVLERVGVRSVAEEQSRDYELPAAKFRETVFRGLEETRPRPAVYLENENDVVLLKTRYRPERVTTQSEENRRVHDEIFRSSMNQEQRHDEIPVNRIFTSQKSASPSIAPKHRTQRQGQMMLGDRVPLPPKSKMANTHGRRAPSAVNAVAEAKDFIALNRNISRTRTRVPSKPDTSFDVDRRFCTGKNDSIATHPVRKRRTLTPSRQPDNAASASSLLEKQRCNKTSVATRNGPQIRTTTVNQTFLKSRPARQRGSKDTVRTDVVSFTFNSPVKSSIGTSSHSEMGGRKTDAICSVNENGFREESMMEEHGVKDLSQNYLRMNGDALGALLEQKLRELTNQVENEATTGFKPSARTTASILQELISALTTERPISSEGRDHGPDTSSECYSEVVDDITQANSRSKRSSEGFTRAVDHYSPGCVLDASFSNESCISSSTDDNSVKPAVTDADFLDSASSTNKARRSDITVVTDLVNHASTALKKANCVNAKLTGTKLDYVQEIVLNAELLFGNAGVHGSSRFLDFLLGPFLDELETLVIAAWKNSIIVGIDLRKEDNPLRRFLLDCLVECLDVKYNRYIDSGLRTLSRLPKSLNAEALIKVFDEEVRKWISFAGKTPDEIIEKEMSTSLGKWTDFEIETYETGAQINQDIVQSLVDEIVMDLCGSELSFC